MKSMWRWSLIELTNKGSYEIYKCKCGLLGRTPMSPKLFYQIVKYVSGVVNVVVRDEFNKNAIFYKGTSFNFSMHLLNDLLQNPNPNYESLEIVGGTTDETLLSALTHSSTELAAFSIRSGW